MFTGIIEQTARVKKMTRSKDGMVVVITKPTKWKNYLGESITVNGVCSTVIKKGSTLVFEYMPESLERSAIGELKENEIVNLEQSLRLGDRLSGHMVQGHVDTTAKIISIVPEGNSRVFTFALPNKKTARYVAEKGSVALDGISLTITSLMGNRFSVKILPYTLKHTNLGTRKVGERINVEFDMLAKYIDQLLANR